MQTQSETVGANSSRKTARIFYYGNIIAGLIPFPVMLLWFAGSILVYAMLRHHPNGRVGYYTQLGAYNFYGLCGAYIVLLTFAGKEFFMEWWWAVWIFNILVLVPYSVMQILKINRETWQDAQVTTD